jgi:hypothetical protein
VAASPGRHGCVSLHGGGGDTMDPSGVDLHQLEHLLPVWAVGGSDEGALVHRTLDLDHLLGREHQEIGNVLK